MNISDYIDALLNSSFGEQVTHHRLVPAKEACYGEPARPWSVPVQNVLENQNIQRLFSHQAEAVNAIRAGQHVIVATPTASGKSLIYNLPVLETFVHDRDAKALYIFPLKALSQDQCKTFQSLVAFWPQDFRPSIAIYDGDTPAHTRRKLRMQPPSVLITTPEMLHLGIVPYYEKWATFFAGLSHIVVDEAHTYRGVLGAHMAQLFQRLRRVAARYGARPSHIFCTATVGNPEELAQGLLGNAPQVESHNVHEGERQHIVHTSQVRLIHRSGAPQGPRHFIFLDPVGSPSTAAIGLLKSALTRQLRTIVYCRSRRMTELLALWAQGEAGQWESRIAAYRAGFLPEERRDIEQKMHSGQLLAVISTSALELGIDIGSLDLCILVGYPGTIMSTLQRGGRVGRAQQESAVVLVAGEDALDQYMIRHPQAFFSRPAEKAVINIDNEVILQRHIECAAAEMPLRATESDATWLQSAAAQAAMAALHEQGRLLFSADGKSVVATRKRPQRHVDLRGSGTSFTIENTEGTLIGMVDGIRAFRETHPGAVYVHGGFMYEIASLDIERKAIVAKRARVSWFTQVRSQKHTKILRVHKHKVLGCTRIFYGNLRITEHITGYEKRSSSGNRLLSIEPLDFPPHVFETEGLWIVVPDHVRVAIEKNYLHFMGAIHALEHAAIGMLPVLVMADRNDFGGISTPLHPQLGLSAVFVYDGLPGGAGLCRQAYEDAEKLFEITGAVMDQCQCDDGCPSCVHSPKCGSGNRPISKEGAKVLMNMLATHSEEAHMLPPVLFSVSPELCDDTHIAAVHKGKAEKQSNDKPLRFMVLDVETRRSAAEVGGWHKAADMGVSVAVVFDSAQNTAVDGDISSESNPAFLAFSQDELPQLFALLRKADVVVGFNISRFDYAVLQPFADYALADLPTLDILTVIKKRLSYRVSLGNVAQATLGVPKSADGLQALAWWKEQKLDAIEAYCKQDVDITRRIYEYGREHGYVLFCNKAEKKVRVPVKSFVFDGKM